MKTPKLNKSQLLEFDLSGINAEYAELNFCNITKKLAPELLNVRDEISRKLKGTALLGGWSDHSFSIFKPKSPRTFQGSLVKYESLSRSRLLEVHHPAGKKADIETSYVVEGFKKAVSTGQRSGSRVIAFNGLTHGISLIEEINALPGSVRLILDNDNTIGAINTARSLVQKLRPDTQIALFRGFKGIDDAFAAGVTLDQIKFVNAVDWSANYSGYISGKQYTFHKPQFKEIEIPANVTFVSVLGGKGTGKTWFMEYQAKKQIESRNIHVITHRIVLSRANAKRLAIPYIDDESYESGSVGLCIDSLMKLKLSDFVGATLFIDEITQVVDHLINSSTLRHKRAVIVKRLQEILLTLSETGGMLIVADADIDAKSLQFLKALGSIHDEKCFSIQNTFVFKKGFARHTYGVHKATNSGISERLFPVDVVKKIKDAALDGKRLFCCLSAQTEEATYSTQTIEAYLLSKGVPESNICRIDSDTIGDPDAKGYNAASRINELCEKYPIVLASPTLNTGVDIQYQYFDHAIGIATGVLSSNSVRQFLGRPRNWEIERIIYAPEQKQTFQETSITNFSDLELYKKAHSDALQCFDAAWFSEFDSQKQKLIEATTSYFLNASHEAQRDRFEYATRIKQGLLLEGYQVAEFESDCDPNEAAEIYKELKFHSEALTLQKYLERRFSRSR